MIENVTYWRDPAIKGLETCLVLDSRHSFPKHAHDAVYAVGLMEKGGSYSLGPGKDEGFVGAGDIALINPGQVHSGVPARDIPVTYRMLYFDIDLVQAAAGDLQAGDYNVPEFRPIVVHNPALQRKLMQLCLSMAAKAGNLEKESILVEALARLLAEYAGIRKVKALSGHHPRAVRQAKECMAANLDMKISLEEMARGVGLSRYHLLRVFKKHTGVPPHLFRTQRRIDLAKQLLRQGMPLAQVALDTGFVDQSHFTNKFRQFTGATPTQYLSPDFS